MTKREVEELGDIVGQLPNYTEDYHAAKYMLIGRLTEWLEGHKMGDGLVAEFQGRCW